MVGQYSRAKSESSGEAPTKVVDEKLCRAIEFDSGNSRYARRRDSAFNG